MMIDDLLTTLNLEYYGNTGEIIAVWFDKDHTAGFLDEKPDDDTLTEAWNNIASDVQEDLEHLLEFNNFIYDVVEKLKVAIKEVEQEYKYVVKRKDLNALRKKYKVMIDYGCNALLIEPIVDRLPVAEAKHGLNFNDIDPIATRYHKIGRAHV